jgi:hypothetical protein
MGPEGHTHIPPLFSCRSMDPLIESIDKPAWLGSSKSVPYFGIVASCRRSYVSYITVFFSPDDGRRTVVVDMARREAPWSPLVVCGRRGAHPPIAAPNKKRCGGGQYPLARFLSIEWTTHCIASNPVVEMRSTCSSDDCCCLLCVWPPDRPDPSVAPPTPEAFYVPAIHLLIIRSSHSLRLPSIRPHIRQGPGTLSSGSSWLAGPLL